MADFNMLKITDRVKNYIFFLLFMRFSWLVTFSMCPLCREERREERAREREKTEEGGGHYFLFIVVSSTLTSELLKNLGLALTYIRMACFCWLGLLLFWLCLFLLTVFVFVLTVFVFVLTGIAFALTAFVFVLTGFSVVLTGFAFVDRVCFCSDWVCFCFDRVCFYWLFFRLWIQPPTLFCFTSIVFIKVNVDKRFRAQSCFGEC